MRDMTQSDEKAREIYQDLLDQIGFAIVERDKERYLGYFIVPHQFQTFEKSLVIKSFDELGTYYDKLLEHLASRGVAELTRHCTVAQFVDADTIQGYHETKLINKSLVILEDYIALSILTRLDDGWKVSASQYAESAASLPSQVTK